MLRLVQVHIMDNFQIKLVLHNVKILIIQIIHKDYVNNVIKLNVITAQLLQLNVPVVSLIVIKFFLITIVYVL